MLPSSTTRLTASDNQRHYGTPVEQAPSINTADVRIEEESGEQQAQPTQPQTLANKRIISVPLPGRIEKVNTVCSLKVLSKGASAVFATVLDKVEQDLKQNNLARRLKQFEEAIDKQEEANRLNL